MPWGYISGEYGTYDMGGYAVDLPAGNAAQANAILRQLKQDEWLGESVQGEKKAGRAAALFVTFTTYNPNVNIFAYNRILIEFAPSGEVHSSIKFRHYARAKFRPGNAGSQVPPDRAWHHVFLWLIALLRHGCKSMGSNLDSTFDSGTGST